MIPKGKMIGAISLLLIVTPTIALAEIRHTAEQKAACMGDALSLCSSVIPNKQRIATCLASKMSQLSPRCRAQFTKR